MSDPSIFDGMPTDTQNALYAQVAALEADLRARLLIRRPADATPEPDRLIDANEAAKLLGTTVDHVWAMMRRGQLSWVQVGKKYHRVRLSAVHAYIGRKDV